MKPLHVTAHLFGAIASAPMLDALLQALVAMRDGLPPVDTLPERRPLRVDIPIAIEPGGRFHLCSSPQCARAASELRYVNRRFPIEQASRFGGKDCNRVNLSSGPEKSYRIPVSVGFFEQNKVDWFCIGDADEIRELLRLCRYLGKKRSIGNGKVRAWDVEECEAWDGFPVVRAGAPLRPLPVDWPGLVDPSLAYAVLGTIGVNYWDHTAKELCAVPE